MRQTWAKPTAPAAFGGHRLPRAWGTGQSPANRQWCAQHPGRRGRKSAACLAVPMAGQGSTPPSSRRERVHGPQGGRGPHCLPGVEPAQAGPRRARGVGGGGGQGPSARTPGAVEEVGYTHLPAGRQTQLLHFPSTPFLCSWRSILKFMSEVIPLPSPQLINPPISSPVLRIKSKPYHLIWHLPSLRFHLLPLPSLHGLSTVPSARDTLALDLLPTGCHPHLNSPSPWQPPCRSSNTTTPSCFGCLHHLCCFIFIYFLNSHCKQREGKETSDRVPPVHTLTYTP